MAGFGYADADLPNLPNRVYIGEKRLAQAPGPCGRLGRARIAPAMAIRDALPLVSAQRIRRDLPYRKVNYAWPGQSSSSLDETDEFLRGQRGRHRVEEERATGVPPGSGTYRFSVRMPAQRTDP